MCLVWQPQVGSDNLELRSPRVLWDGVDGFTVVNKKVPGSGKLLAQLWTELSSSAKHGLGLQ